jgi:uncharacterized protein
MRFGFGTSVFGRRDHGSKKDPGHASDNPGTATARQGASSADLLGSRRRRPLLPQSAKLHRDETDTSRTVLSNRNGLLPPQPSSSIPVRQKKKRAPHQVHLQSYNAYKHDQYLFVILVIPILILVSLVMFLLSLVWIYGGAEDNPSTKEPIKPSNTEQKDSRTTPSIQYPLPFPVIHRDSSEGQTLLSTQAIEMCTKTLWHTLESTTIVLPNEETFIFTGDIDDLWIRDSTAQVHPLLIPFFNPSAIAKEDEVPVSAASLNGDRYALIALDKRLERIVSGLIKRLATYIRHDPYANAFRIDNTYVFSDAQKQLGRHDLISTWNYELDSACYFFRLLYFYYKESVLGGIKPMPGNNVLSTVPEKSVLRLPQVKEAVEIMVELWRAEQHHEDDQYPKGPLFDCANCNKPYRYPGLARDGKGSPTNSSSGLTWTGFRPSDDECKYHFLIPANMFAVATLGYVTELAEAVWQDLPLAQKARTLSEEIDNGIQAHGIVPHPEDPTRRIYAYEVDGLGNAFLMDDANVPSLLSIPYLGYTTYDATTYRNTRDFIFSSANPTYKEGSNPITGFVRGYGSPHMNAAIPNNIWPMAMVR